MPEEDSNDDSWQVRAFEEDTAAANLMGCTWPPRSYTCTFCRREFRSAQALGGHMNVHRRDRARRLHEPPLPPPPAAANNIMPPAGSSLFVHTAQELIENGFCLVYSLPNPNGLLVNPPPPSMAAAHSDEPSTASTSNDNNETSLKHSAIEEDVDLELRLGRKSPSQGTKRKHSFH